MDGRYAEYTDIKEQAQPLTQLASASRQSIKSAVLERELNCSNDLNLAGNNHATTALLQLGSKIKPLSNNAYLTDLAYALCIMQYYAVCNDFPANKVGFTKKLCTMRIMHYDVMHYEKVYCISLVNKLPKFQVTMSVHIQKV